MSEAGESDDTGWDEWADCRCDDCIAMCIECPRGYGVYPMTCGNCEHRLVVMRPECATFDVEDSECPNCSLHEMEIDGVRELE